MVSGEEGAKAAEERAGEEGAVRVQRGQDALAVLLDAGRKGDELIVPGRIIILATAARVEQARAHYSALSEIWAETEVVVLAH